MAKDDGKKVMTLEALHAEIQKKYGNIVAGALPSGVVTNNLAVRRYSTGIYAVDESIGGGIPIGKIILIAGEPSQGKTEFCLQCAGAVGNYDKFTRTHKLLIPEEKLSLFKPSSVAYIDAEGTFDLDWASKKGFDPAKDVVIRPPYGNAVVDIVNEIILNNLYDLIIIDSLAACTPLAEADSSAEDVQVGAQARLLNKAFRMWVTSACRASSRTGLCPTVICVNQMRYKIGVMFGDPRTLPGGQGQNFANAVTIYTKSAKYDDNSSEATGGRVALSGVVFKNKTYKPKQLFEYDLALSDSRDGLLLKGRVDNVKSLLQAGLAASFVVRKGSAGFELFGANYSSKDVLYRELSVNENLKFKLWRNCLNRLTGHLWT